MKKSLLLYFAFTVSIISSCGIDNGSQKNIDRQEDLYRIGRKLGNHRFYWKSGKINGEFLPYIEEFEHYYKKKLSISVTFGKTISQTVDVFDKVPDPAASSENLLILGIKNIKINRNYWNKMSEEMKKICIFHELGHAVLLKGHRDGHTSHLGIENVPVSIMNPVLSEEDALNITDDKLWPIYIEELFD